MFQDSSAWFSSSVDHTYIDLWSGSVESTCNADLLPEYLFSCDPEQQDTLWIINNISYMVIHPDWIFDTISEKEKKPIEKYILENYNFSDEIIDQNQMNVDKIASLAYIADNSKSNDEINSNETTDLANNNQSNGNNYIVAHSTTIPNKIYLLPRKRARKVSKGKNHAQDNNTQQAMPSQIMNIQSDDLQTDDLQIDTVLPDSRPDDQSEWNIKSRINKSKRDRPRTLPDFMTKKRPRVALTNTSEDDSFFTDEDIRKRQRVNYFQKSARASSTGKKAPSIHCECGRSVQPTMSVEQLLTRKSKNPPHISKETKPISSIRLQHISVRYLLEKVSKYLSYVKGSDSNLMDNVYEFTPGQNGFFAQSKSTANSRVSNANSRGQTRGKSSIRKFNF
ncbi:1015_t:CDS:2 [Funneliformis mosseae]|uniref:1015_t:CDS:1 n=1 Tax=Funneliformis mosseae TaxID=27381 RepID=A0A9N9E0B5_FUNMO|nr:1015_t:CDS:2 [Funneliformis mosseae]